MARSPSVTVRLAGATVVYKETSTSFRALRGQPMVTALHGVTAEFSEGETVGVLGANGAGKSTLMRVIAGVTPLDSGVVLTSSRPSLLTVGSVLVPSASGYENAVLGCLSLGMARRSAKEEARRIIEFAGLERAADRALSTYSSGMAARLKFSIVTHCPTPIVILDEALAVGDAAFKAKCRERLREVRSDASTVFLVSHSLSVVRDSCTRAILLCDGRIVEDGPASEVCASYEAQRNG